MRVFSSFREKRCEENKGGGVLGRYTEVGVDLKFGFV